MRKQFSLGIAGQNATPPTLVSRARPIIIFVGAIWAVYLVDLILPLEQLGLVPRSFSGLTGIVTMPFLHGSFTHLISNTLPLIILLGLMALSRPRPWSTMILLTLISGAALWLFGRPALHIGASGLIYALMGFLIAAGVFETSAGAGCGGTLCRRDLWDVDHRRHSSRSGRRLLGRSSVWPARRRRPRLDPLRPKPPSLMRYCALERYRDCSQTHPLKGSFSTQVSKVNDVATPLKKRL